MSTLITFYCSQPLTIAKQIKQGQTHYAKMDAIKEKYGATVAPIFTQAYTWFIQEAKQLVHKPDDAESAIWVYHNLRDIEKHDGYELFELAIPLEEIVFFKMSDWNKILNQRFLSTNNQEELAFTTKLAKQGIDYEGDIFRKPFYPQLKQEIMKSWKQLFRFHQTIQNDFRQGISPQILDLQGALWKLPKHWVTSTIV